MDCEFVDRQSWAAAGHARSATDHRLVAGDAEPHVRNGPLPQRHTLGTTDRRARRQCCPRWPYRSNARADAAATIRRTLIDRPLEGADMSTLSREEIARRLQSLHGWTLDGNAIKKQYTFRDFPEAVGFVDRLVPIAQAADHHPDILISYKRVTLTYSTHSEGGLTDKDFDGAVAADR